MANPASDSWSEPPKVTCVIEGTCALAKARQKVTKTAVDVAYRHTLETRIMSFKRASGSNLQLSHQSARSMIDGKSTDIENYCVDPKSCVNNSTKRNSKRPGGMNERLGASPSSGSMSRAGSNAFQGRVVLFWLLAPGSWLLAAAPHSVQ